MRFLFRNRIGPYRIALSIGKVTDVEGINSNVVGGGHIVMWEFDITDYGEVWAALKTAQIEWNLPTITIARSHPDGGFHAYCFPWVTWLQSLSIVASTAHVDEAYINLCAMRNHWTLRITDKGQGAPQYLAMIPSAVEPLCSFLDLASHVKYEAHTSKNIIGWGMIERL